MNQLKIHARPIATLKADAVGILVAEGNQFTPSGSQVDGLLRGQIARTLRSEAFRVKPRNILVYYAPGAGFKKVLCVAIPGKERTLSAIREAAYDCVKRAAKHGIKKLALAFDPADAGEVQAIAEGALLATYRYDEFKSKKDAKGRIAAILVCTTLREPQPLRRAEAHFRAAQMVRDLVNEPPGSLRPVQLAEKAQKTARQSKLACRVFEPAELQRMGANLFLSVGKGSEVPSRMVHLTYEPAGKAVAHVALVGKGVTFDSGGLSLKSEAGMEHMKSDMTGAAVVLACLRGAKELKLPVKITGLMMVTENMPDGGANRPGDIVRAMNGKTVEITNTDAEGRLALADGLTYAQRLKPDTIIDIATLTGAQVVSLGRLIGAVMGNNQDLVQKIVAAGKKSGELIWELPLHEPYKELMKSDVADVKNSSGIPEAGSIQGGLFLSEFVDHPRWAHMDVSGPSWQEREWSVYPRAASGFPVRCLLTFLSDLK